MENGISTIFESFALPIAMIIVLLMGIILLFKYLREQNDKHDEIIRSQSDNYNAQVREMSEKYHESFLEVQKTNASVAEAIHENARAIETNSRLVEKLFDKLDAK